MLYLFITINLQNKGLRINQKLKKDEQFIFIISVINHGKLFNRAYFPPRPNSFLFATLRGGFYILIKLV